eukprot:g406.t1
MKSRILSVVLLIYLVAYARGQENDPDEDQTLRQSAKHHGVQTSHLGRVLTADGPMESPMAAPLPTKAPRPLLFFQRQTIELRTAEECDWYCRITNECKAWTFIHVNGICYLYYA